VIVRDLVEACCKLAAAGQAIMLVEQNLAATLALANRAYIINNGHIVCTKAPRRKSKRGRKYCTGTSASSHYPGSRPHVRRLPLLPP
jgi:ABC-type branched-subunit amino acid transport system ATPase component